MGVINLLKGSKPQLVIPGVPRAARPVEMLYRFLPNNQVIWVASDQEGLLKNGFLNNHPVFIIQDWVASKVAQTPFLLYEKKSEKEYKKYQTLLKSNSPDGIKRAFDAKLKALVEVESSEIMKVLERPNPGMSWYEFAYGSCVYKSFTGSFYWQGVRAGSVNDPTVGKIKQMYLPPAHHMRAMSGGLTQPVKEWFLLTNPEIKIDAQNVWQSRNFSPDYTTPTEHLYGLPRIYPARKIVQKFNEGTETETELLQKKGIRDLVSPKNRGSGADAEHIDYEEMQKHRDEWDKKINESGPGSVMLANTELTSIRIGFTPEEMGLLASRKEDKKDFCALWHVQDIIFGWSEQTTYNNMLEARKMSLSDAVIPELEAFKEGFNSWLIPSYYGPNSRYVIDADLDVFPEMQEDIDKKINRMIKSNSFSVNEMREAQGYGAATDENSEKIIVSGGAKLLENLGMETFAGDPSLIADEEDPK